MEIWKDIQGYEELYQVSNLGNVRSKTREWEQKHYSGGKSKYKKEGKILKVQADKNGYMHIDLHKGKKIERVLIHRLVATHFIDNPNKYKYINHIDSNPKNNKVNNLEWCTQSHNILHAYEKGNKKPPHRRRVVQKNYYTDEIIYTYSSISQAHRLTGFNNIGACCRGLRKKAGGYKWEYV